ncbi:MAG: tetratricopeptide repeat protein [Patescibacteria group bacterium]
MVVDIILGIIAALSLGGIIWMFIKKMPVLKMINTERLVSIKQQQVKTNLTEARLIRKLATMMTAVRVAAQPITEVIKKYSGSLSQKVKLLEEEMKQKLITKTEGLKPLDDLYQQADQALAKENFESAERLYLEIIRQSPKEIRAYDGLGDLYLADHDFESAQELYSYLVNHHSEKPIYHVGLAKALVGQGQLEGAKFEYLSYLEKDLNGNCQVYFDLAQLYKDLGQIKEAWEAINRARLLESSNPRILDFFIEISIVNERPTDAQSALDVLREVNPENNKISQFDKIIRELVEKLRPKHHTTSLRQIMGQPLAKFTKLVKRKKSDSN